MSRLIELAAMARESDNEDVIAQYHSEAWLDATTAATIDEQRRETEADSEADSYLVNNEPAPDESVIEQLAAEIDF